jgi:hypothetical protein
MDLIMFGLFPIPPNPPVPIVAQLPPSNAVAPTPPQNAPREKYGFVHGRQGTGPRSLFLDPAIIGQVVRDPDTRKSSNNFVLPGPNGQKTLLPVTCIESSTDQFEFNFCWADGLRLNGTQNPNTKDGIYNPGDELADAFLITNPPNGTRNHSLYRSAPLKQIPVNISPYTAGTFMGPSESREEPVFYPDSDRHTSQILDVLAKLSHIFRNVRPQTD